MSTASPVFVSPDGGRKIRIFGGVEFTVKLSSEETGGAFTLLDNTQPAGTYLPPHVHAREDETFHILEGEFEFYVEGQTLRAGPGATVFAPRGTPHSFRVVGETPGRTLIVTAPGGFERCMEEISKLQLDPPDMPAILGVAARHGIEFLPPPEA